MLRIVAIALFSFVSVARAEDVCAHPPPPGNHVEWCRACPGRCDGEPPSLVPDYLVERVPPFCVAPGCMPEDPSRERVRAAFVRQNVFLQYGGALSRDPVDAEIVRGFAGELLEAVSVAPGDPHRRYDLACVLNAAGRPADALRELEALTRSDLPEVRNALARIEHDPFCGWKESPGLERIRKSARKTPVYEAALAVSDAFAKGDRQAFAGLVSRARTLVVLRHMTLSDPPDDLEWHRLRGAGAVAEWSKAYWPSQRIGAPPGTTDGAVSPGLACEGRCCSTVRTMMSHDTQYLDGFCFDSVTHPRLVSLELSVG